MEKILKELESIKNNRGFAEAIGSYIADKCRVDGKFEERVMMKEKELDQCLKYIMSEVRRKTANATSVAATDEEVFKIVDEYYTLDNSAIKINERVSAEVQTPRETAKKEETYAKVDPPEKVEVKKPEKKSVLNKKVKERDPLIDNQVTVFDLLR
jgi:nicotinamide mononucleotide adenylyltransferase